jgi:hypothetical protein
MSEISLRPFITVVAQVAAPLEFGPARRCIPIVGGAFHGALEGAVPPGTDWQTIAADGTLDIAAHYALRTRDGALIEVRSRGVRAGPPDVLARLARGEDIDPADYYFRTSMRFHSDAPALARLNRMLALSRGARRHSSVRLEVFEVL